MAPCAGSASPPGRSRSRPTLFIGLGALGVADAFTPDPHRVRPAHRRRVSHAGDGRPADRDPPAAQPDRVDTARRALVPTLQLPLAVLLGEGWALQLDRALWPILYAWPIAVAFVFPNGRLLSPRWRWVALGAAVSFAGFITVAILDPEPFYGDDARVPNPMADNAVAGWLGERLCVVVGPAPPGDALQPRRRRGCDSHPTQAARSGSSGCRPSGSRGRRRSSRSRSSSASPRGSSASRWDSRSSTGSSSRCCS